MLQVCISNDQVKRQDKAWQIPRTQDFEMAYEHIKQIFTFESVHQDMYMYDIEQINSKH